MIRLFHVSRRFPGGAVALDDVSLHIGRGEMVYLTGPSGAGKTTLLKLLYAADHPTEGQILIEGVPVHALNRRQVPHLRRKVGMVFQDFRLLGELTAFENVALVLDVLGRSPTEVRRRTMSVLHQVGLGDKSSQRPPRLSGGEQQRVALARALVHEPLLLLADEPTGNLDAARGHEVMSLIAAANARGTTAIIATHDDALRAAWPRRTLSLREGRLTDDGRDPHRGGGSA